MKKLFYLIAIVAFTLTSCNDNEVTKQKEVNIYNTTEIPNGMMKLGEKMENPYSVSNMKKAYSNLSMQKIASNISATHLYVRFLPDNAEEMHILTSDTILKLYDYPLDYKIEVDGQYYHDPLIPLDKITWQYTVVPVNYEFPKVKYEILEELYLTEDDEVEYQALKITGNITDSETKTNVKQNGLKASQYYPSGSIKIQDNTLNTEIGLKNITV